MLETISFLGSTHWGLSIHGQLASNICKQNQLGRLQSTEIKSDLDHIEQPDKAPKLEGNLEVRVKVGFLDVL